MSRFAFAYMSVHSMHICIAPPPGGTSLECLVEMDSSGLFHCCLLFIPILRTGW
jgi:hypothetical protein